MALPLPVTDMLTLADAPGSPEPVPASSAGAAAAAGCARVRITRTRARTVPPEAALASAPLRVCRRARAIVFPIGFTVRTAAPGSTSTAATAGCPYVVLRDYGRRGGATEE